MIVKLVYYGNFSVDKQPVISSLFHVLFQIFGYGQGV